MPDLPVVCTLSPAALKARKENLLRAVIDRAVERHELPDGYRLQLASAPDILALVARMIEAERQCCRFLRFSVTVEPDGGPVRVDLTGPPGTPDFLAAMTGE